MAFLINVLFFYSSEQERLEKIRLEEEEKQRIETEARAAQKISNEVR